MTQTEKALTRRSFVVGSATLGISSLVGAAAFSAASQSQAFASDPSEVDSEVVAIDEGLTGESVADIQYGFSMNLYNCVDCEKCVEACRYYNHLSDDTPNRRNIVSMVQNKLETVYVSTTCMHCAEPSCMTVCPAQAISKGDGGIVKVDKDRCIGCKYCFQACPFSVPHYNAQGMDKCDCCTDIGLPIGEDPYCVQACIFDALHYGPLEELIEQAGEAGQLIDASTKPSCVLVKA